MGSCTNTCIIDCKGPKVRTFFFYFSPYQLLKLFLNSQGFWKLKTKEPRLPLELNQAFAVKKRRRRRKEERSLGNFRCSFLSTSNEDLWCLNAFLLFICSALRDFSTHSDIYVLQIQLKKASARYLFLVTHKI